MKHIVIFRTSGSFLDFNTYNCQELGLAKALVKKGYKLSLILGGPTKSISFMMLRIGILIFTISLIVLSNSRYVFFMVGKSYWMN